MKSAVQLSVLALFAVLVVRGQPTDTTTKTIYDHLKVVEGFKLVGYIPTAGSGVTIATGVDLGQFSASQLTNLGVSKALLNKVSVYLGKNTRAKVQAAGLTASNLKITNAEAWELDSGFLAENRKKLANYFGKMSTKGQAVLVSLRHWNGSLKNSFDDGKLTRKVGGALVSYVWDAVKDNKATDSAMLSALKKTQATFSKGTVGYNRFQNEITYLS